MTKRLISRAEFSKQADVSRAAVTKACGSSLKDAVDGKSIDIDHPAAIAYIESKRASKTAPPAKKPPRAKKLPKKKIDAIPPEDAPPTEGSHYSKDDEIAEVLHLTLGEIVKHHGTEGQFKAWVDATKTLVDIQTRSVKLAALKKTLVPRLLVETHIFGAIESSNLKLLRDSSKAITRKLFTHVKAGGSLDEGEVLVRRLISSQLKNVSSTAKRILKNA